MKYVRIPMERVAVLIGSEGKTRKIIEKKSNIPISIDSQTGEVTIDDHGIEDPFIIFKIEKIIKAIGRGFSPNDAFHLFNDEYDLFIFNIYDYVKKKSSHVHRVKARIIGKKGKTKRVLETLTGSKIAIYGHTIAIIGNIIDIDITKKAVEQLLEGRKHATVYRYIEKNMKELRLHQNL